LSQIVTKCDPRFSPLLREFDSGLLESDEHIIYGLWPDMRLAFLNPGYWQFAQQNRGRTIYDEWGLGTSLLDAISPPIRTFFATNYQRCLDEGCTWDHCYECSSSRNFRKFQMTTYPLGRSEGLLVVHALTIEIPHEHAIHQPIEAIYSMANGQMLQCCHCRRFKRNQREIVWDWVPAWVDQQPKGCSHSLCEACFGFYFNSAGAA
jgi:hypothetical protein